MYICVPEIAKLKLIVNDNVPLGRTLCEKVFVTSTQVNCMTIVIIATQIVTKNKMACVDVSNTASQIVRANPLRVHALLS
jgi:hypothetical protein